MNVRIRPAEPGDEKRLALVGAATFLEAFAGVLPGDDIMLHCARRHSAGVYAKWLARQEAGLWLAEVDPGEAPVGYAVLDDPDLPIHLRPDDIEVKRVYLLHRFQGGGAGFALMQAGLDWARGRGKRRALLGVYNRNVTAITFYRRLGFRLIGERKFRVGKSWHDDSVMALDL
jgi:GNAT superfamily N-acetyltransferase